MFSYCENNPVMGVDYNGEWVHLAVGAIVGGIIGGISAAKSDGNILVGVITGALGGVLTASGAGIAAQVAGSAAISAVSSAANQLISKPLSSFSIREVGEEALVGAISGLAGGKGASFGNAKSIMGYGKQVVKQVKRNLKHGKSIIKPIGKYCKKAHNGSRKFVMDSFVISTIHSNLASFAMERTKQYW